MNLQKLLGEEAVVLLIQGRSQPGRSFVGRVNQRAAGMGGILGRKAFQRTMRYCPE